MNTYTIVVLYVGGTENVEVKADHTVEAFQKAAQVMFEKQVNVICSMTLMGFIPGTEEKDE